MWIKTPVKVEIAKSQMTHPILFALCSRVAFCTITSWKRIRLKLKIVQMTFFLLSHAKWFCQLIKSQMFSLLKWVCYVFLLFAFLTVDALILYLHFMKMDLFSQFNTNRLVKSWKKWKESQYYQHRLKIDQFKGSNYIGVYVRFLFENLVIDT